jgi:hypothetical protein
VNRFQEFGRRVRVRFALLANGSQQSLGDNTHYGRRDFVRLDTHVHHPVNRTRRIIRVQRAEHEVAGQSSLHGDPRRVRVANLSDHDRVRVLTKNGPQHRTEGQGTRLVDLHLVDQVDLILDRILDRQNIPVDRLNEFER